MSEAFFCVSSEPDTVPCAMMEKTKTIGRFFPKNEENLQNLPTLSLPTVGKAFCMKISAKKFNLL
ncbi:MAG: hypothetical protein EAZ95_15190 [Bacteroidetes bacterium]|nr:MAG: hypothetical protein EAZ95_15190 [Bacteroidota bacterium]